MTKLIIEVIQEKSVAEARANYYQQLGCTVAPIKEYTDVTWINKTRGGNSDTASDPVDSDVWVVIASK